jgi:hypothetical protein
MHLDNEMGEWVERLSGLEHDRVQTALRRVEHWKVSAIQRLPQDLDVVIALTLLSESFDELRARGIHESKLLGKLRHDPLFWATWAEIRAMALMIRHVPDLTVEAEPEKKRGSRHPDFRLMNPGGGSTGIEFKAIGLSDEEAQFCSRAAKEFDNLRPPVGLVTVHAELASELSVSNFDQEMTIQKAAELAARVPHYPKGLCGVAFVGHGGEANYVRRMTARLRKEAVRQIPIGTQGWVAFHWTNGAPMGMVIDAIEWSDLPSRVLGLIFVGDAMVFPDANIHSFVHIVPRSVRDRSSKALQTKHDTQVVACVLDRLERASGVRATRLSVNTAQGVRILVNRDGTRRISPFFMLLDRDPPQGALIHATTVRQEHYARSDVSPLIEAPPSLKYRS